MFPRSCCKFPGRPSGGPASWRKGQPERDVGNLSPRLERWQSARPPSRRSSAGARSPRRFGSGNQLFQGLVALFGSALPRAPPILPRWRSRSIPLARLPAAGVPPASLWKRTGHGSRGIGEAGTSRLSSLENSVRYSFPCQEFFDRREGEPFCRGGRRPRRTACLTTDEGAPATVASPSRLGSRRTAFGRPFA